MSQTHALEGYLQCCLERAGATLHDSASAPTILRELAGSVLASGEPTSWARRPAITDDGTPIVLSWKADREHDQHIRVLAESGTLAMTVAEQIAYSLARLDRLLGALNWRSASQAINTITAQALPANASVTQGWRGGIWLGADVKADSSDTELRMYLNLRSGEAVDRWRRLQIIVSTFASESIHEWLSSWVEVTSTHALPVGLGVVVSDGAVKGIRAYLSVESPSFDSIHRLTPGLMSEAYATQRRACDTFKSRCGAMHTHGVTVGYDFVPGATQPRRVKVDICCHTLPLELAPSLQLWIDELLQELRYEPFEFQEFLRTIQAFWKGSTVQFVSLGFDAKDEHLTVYVKPNASTRS